MATLCVCIAQDIPVLLLGVQKAAWHKPPSILEELIDQFYSGASLLLKALT
jgi:hypothetical protein